MFAVICRLEAEASSQLVQVAGSVSLTSDEMNASFGRIGDNACRLT
jgi:hypothetical protein